MFLVGTPRDVKRSRRQKQQHRLLHARYAAMEREDMHGHVWRKEENARRLEHRREEIRRRLWSEKEAEKRLECAQQQALCDWSPHNTTMEHACTAVWKSMSKEDRLAVESRRVLDGPVTVCLHNTDRHTCWVDWVLFPASKLGKTLEERNIDAFLPSVLPPGMDVFCVPSHLPKTPRTSKHLDAYRQHVLRHTKQAMDKEVAVRMHNECTEDDPVARKRCKYAMRNAFRAAWFRQLGGQRIGCWCEPTGLCYVRVLSDLFWKYAWQTQNVEPWSSSDPAEHTSVVQGMDRVVMPWQGGMAGNDRWKTLEHGGNAVDWNEVLASVLLRCVGEVWFWRTVRQGSVVDTTSCTTLCDAAILFIQSEHVKRCIPVALLDVFNSLVHAREKSPRQWSFQDVLPCQTSVSGWTVPAYRNVTKRTLARKLFEGQHVVGTET